MAVLLLAGCDTMESVRDRVTQGPPPQERIFAAEPRATYAAVQAALRSLDFRQTHGGPAEGTIDALSAIQPGDNPGGARQVSVHAELRAVDGGTAVDVQMKEILEDDSQRHPGMATSTALRDTPMYEVFFHAVQAALAPASRK
ncbi:MAG TPA: hypothetical protein VHC86_13365 [Opitutaceae bacterium]|nr:hypothetical protein [Opitutaceae bacterium]